MKNVVVFGASGKTGALIVQQALDAGHRVTAAMRRPETFTLQHAQLVTVKSDIYDTASVEAALRGQEVIISAIAAPTSRKPIDTQAHSARVLLDYMQTLGIPRFLGISSGGTNPVYDRNLSFLFQYVFKPLFRGTFDDHTAMERVVAESQANWTLARPVQLTDGAHTKSYRLAAAYSLPGGNTISRADVADFLVKQIETTTYSRQAVAIGY